MGAGPGAGPRRGGAGDLAEEKAGLGGGGRDRAEEGGAWPRGRDRGRAEKGASRVEEGARLRAQLCEELLLSMRLALGWIPSTTKIQLTSKVNKKAGLTMYC